MVWKQNNYLYPLGVIDFLRGIITNTLFEFLKKFKYFLEALFFLAKTQRRKV